MGWHRWAPYVPVAVRRAKALKKMQKLRKKGQDIQPVEIQGRKISSTFWGKAWCDHLESFSDYSNRLPRGRTYVRNGSVCHLDVAKGEVNAMVSGSELYKVKIEIKTLSGKKWKTVKTSCAGQIGSLLELLQGRLSDNVMTVVTDRKEGLFPRPGEIALKCNCPDWAVMCKHVAAVLYGVAARLDQKPELLFLLRGVDHEELIDAKAGATAVATGKKGGRKRIADDALTDVFGIDISEEPPTYEGKRPRRRKLRATKKTAAKKSAGNKASRPPAKAPAKRKAKTGAKRKPLKAASIKPITGKAVARLRARFEMNRTQFARLLGVSAPSVTNWEKQRGKLNLQPRTLKAWTAVQELSERQAWRRAGGA